MPKQVVITRPLAQAQALARRVQEVGRQPVVFPLLEIHPLRDPAPLLAALDTLDGFAMAAFVSPNAIDAVFAHLTQWPPAVALAVMGEGSRAALARHGLSAANARIFSPRDQHRTDSQTLLEVLDLDQLRGKRVVIFRGESGRELLADALRAAGVEVSQVVAYRRAEPVLNQERSAQLSSLLEGDHDWVVTSSEGLRILIRMIEQLAGASGVAKMQQQRIILPHARIAETALALGFKHITRTGSGDEALLAALQSSA